MLPEQGVRAECVGEREDARELCVGAEDARELCVGAEDAGELCVGAEDAEEQDNYLLFISKIFIINTFFTHVFITVFTIPVY